MAWKTTNPAKVVPSATSPPRRRDRISASPMLQTPGTYWVAAKAVPGVLSLEGQLHARRQLEATGRFLGQLRHLRLDLDARVIVGGDDQILEDLGLVRLQQRRIDL